jgi:hypothetical protein
VKHIVEALLLSIFVGGAAAQTPPPNDDPSFAIPIGDGEFGLFTTVGGTNTPGFASSCLAVVHHADVFFLYTAAASGVHVFSTCTPAGRPPGTLTSSVVSVYAVGNPGASLGCDQGSCAGQGALVAPSLSAGSQYLVRVARQGGGADGTFWLQAVPPPPTPVADACAAAPALNEGYSLVSFVGATPSAPTSCGALPPGAGDVWATFVAPSDGPLVVQRENESFVSLAIFTGACGAETPVVGTNTCVNSAAVASTIATFDAVAGTTYLFRMARVGSGVAPAYGWLRVRYAFRLGVEKAPIAPGWASLTVWNDHGPPGHVVLNAMTLNQGAFPNGWLYGVDATFAEFFAYPTLGPPFVSTLDAAGAASWFLPSMPDPFGVALFGVAISIDAAGVVSDYSKPMWIAL